MCQKYLILKKDNDFKEHKVLDEETFEELKCVANILEDFNTLTFLSNRLLSVSLETRESPSCFSSLLSIPLYRGKSPYVRGICIDCFD